MSFADSYSEDHVTQLVELSLRAERKEVELALRTANRSLEHFAYLLSPAAESFLEPICQKSRQLTIQRFGRTIRMFAPLYVSNECINNCTYCGFSRDNPILRVTLSVDEVEREAVNLREKGFRSILLVAGEHPKFVGNGYLEECIKTVRRIVPSVALEVGPMETPEYREMVAAGSEGLVVYQETYEPTAYRVMHTAGPKKDFHWRLATPERAYEAGFRRLGIGALFGLTEWRREALALALHAAYLARRCWKAQLTVAFPRLRPCAGAFEPEFELADRHLVQLIAAFRLVMPDIGIVLSTREPSQLRDGLMSVGITTMSAGSHTEPGGYTNAGSQRLHHTVKGRQVPVEESSFETDQAGSQGATGQFDIADDRSPNEVAASIEKRGYEPVWKDWDSALG